MSLLIEYTVSVYIICRTDNATRDQDYIGLEEQLEFSVNDSVMYVSLRILDEDIPELDKLILLQLYNASYHSSISDQSLLPIIVSANQDFIQDFITIRLKLIASNFHTPKPTICITSMGSCPNFHTPKLKFLRNRTPEGASRAPR